MYLLLLIMPTEPQLLLLYLILKLQYKAKKEKQCQFKDILWFLAKKI